MKFTLIKNTTSISDKFEVVDSTIIKKYGGHTLDCDYETIDTDIIGLKKIIDDADNRTCIIAGTLNKKSGHITPTHRSQFKYIDYQSGLLYLSYVFTPCQRRSVRHSQQQLLEELFEIVPELKELPYLCKHHYDANISNPDGETTGVTGFQLFFEIANVNEVPRINRIIHKRCALRNSIYAFLDDSGRVHTKTLFETNTNAPNFQILLYGDLGKSLKQDISSKIFNEMKDPTTISLDAITRVQERRIINNFKLTNELWEKESLEKRTNYLREYTDSRGVASEVLNYALDNECIFGDFIITLMSGENISVSDIFKRKDEFREGKLTTYCHDPFIVNSGNSVARINVVKREIFSYVNNSSYDLIHDKRMTPIEIATYVSTFPAIVKFKKAAVLIKEYEFLESEVEELIGYLTTQGVTIGSIRRDLTRYRQDEEDPDDNASDDLGRFSLPLEKIRYPYIDASVSGRKPISCVENLSYLLKRYGITYYYDKVINKVFLDLGSDKLDNTQDMAVIENICRINNLKIKVPQALGLLASMKKANPMLDWILSKPLEVTGQLNRVINAVELHPAALKVMDKKKINPDWFKREILINWFVQAVGALDGLKNTPLRDMDYVYLEDKFEYILVLHGNQGIGKTSFFENLLPYKKYPDHLKTEFKLRVNTLYSRTSALESWICSMDEIDGSFRHNSTSDLKSFMSCTRDVMAIHNSYTKVTNDRSTVFAGTVNGKHFISDLTGSRRVLTLPIKSISNFAELKLDHQQFWREIYDIYESGRKFWPTPQLEDAITTVNHRHTDSPQMMNAIKDIIYVDRNERFRKHYNIRGDNSSICTVKPRHKALINGIKFYSIRPSDLLELFKMPIDKYTTNELKAIMHELGFRYGFLTDRKVKRYLNGWWISPLDNDVFDDLLFG